MPLLVLAKPQTKTRDKAWRMKISNKLTKLGGSSLLVPCVQELAKEAKTLPPRYICNVDDHQLVVHSDDLSVSKIPVIDMNRLHSQEFAHTELSKLHLACKDCGFFQLINHGMSKSLLAKMKEDVEDFFNMPMEEKQKLWQSSGEVEGFGQAFVVSQDQKLDWGDLFFLSTLPIHMRKPHLFPNLPLPLRDTLDKYSMEMNKLAMEILGLMGKALEMNENEMKEFFEQGYQSIRMNYYPPCPEPEKVMGLKPHSDSIALTILLQVNEVEGLQVKRHDKWVPVKPLPNAFIVNIGDMLEMITNGTYPSIEHRATVNSEKERLSIATFLSPRYEGDVGPAQSLVTKETPPLFKTLTVEDYFKGLFGRELNGKSYLDAMRL